MNWLAHLYLSEPNSAFRIGNLLPDFVPAGCLREIPVAFQPGIQRHRRIDAFTDTHPVIRRSIARFQPPLRRFGGILVDIFCDHFLARDWARFSPVPLPEFVGEVYASFEHHRHELPAQAYERLVQVREQDWLCSYGDLAGIRLALERLSGRFRRPVALGDAMPVFEGQYAEFEADFGEFFPELATYVSGQRDAGG